MQVEDKCGHCELFWTFLCEKHDVAWKEAKEKFILSDLEDQFNRLNFMKEKFKDCADFIRTEKQIFHKSGVNTYGKN
jgi:hypothetical protein